MRNIPITTLDITLGQAWGHIHLAIHIQMCQCDNKDNVCVLNTQREQL